MTVAVHTTPPRHRRVDLSRIAARAAQVRLKPLLLSLAALPFVVLGHVAYSVVAATRWVLAAVMVGYEDARGKPRAG